MGQPPWPFRKRLDVVLTQIENFQSGQVGQLRSAVQWASTDFSGDVPLRGTL